MSVTLDAKITGTILPHGDRDRYRFQVSYQGQVDISITDSPPEMSLWFEVYDADARRIAGPFHAAREGAENISEVSWPIPGRYHIQVGTRHDAVSSADNYTLTTEFSPVP